MKKLILTMDKYNTIFLKTNNLFGLIYKSILNMNRSAILLVILLIIACKENNQGESNNNLNCVEYWSEVTFSDFCGLTTGNFDFNTIPNDICNADQNGSFPFDDLVSIRVFNHFSSDAARDEYNAEEADATSLTGYSAINNLGDDGFAVLTTEFGQLDHAIIQAVQGTYTVYLEVNGNATNGANNCFDESSVVEFAKALVRPL